MSKFVICQVESGFKFDLMATNKQALATSQVYKSREDCLAGIRAIKEDAPIALLEDQTKADFEVADYPKYELYKDETGGFRFRLMSCNGEFLALSGSYKAKISCTNGIETTRINTIEANKIEG